MLAKKPGQIPGFFDNLKPYSNPTIADIATKIDEKISTTALGTPNDSLLMSYLDLRQAIGIIGMALPFVLVVGKIVLSGPGIQSSISSYYYTVMRDVFVGSLCAIGVFLGAYRGYARIDSLAGNLACIFAIGTALFPTAPILPTSQQSAIGNFHLAFAMMLFLTLAFFSLVLFRKTNSTKTMTPQKIKRNIVYTVCGITILACIALIILVELLQNPSLASLSPVFWLEALAIIAFGVSWFVKGEAILKDETSAT